MKLFNLMCVFFFGLGAGSAQADQFDFSRFSGLWQSEHGTKVCAKEDQYQFIIYHHVPGTDGSSKSREIFSKFAWSHNLYFSATGQASTIVDEMRQSTYGNRNEELFFWRSKLEIQGYFSRGEGDQTWFETYTEHFTVEYKIANDEFVITTYQYKENHIPRRQLYQKVRLNKVSDDCLGNYQD